MDTSSGSKRSLVDAQGNPRGGRRQRLNFRVGSTASSSSPALVISSSTGLAFDSEEALGWVKGWAWNGLSSIQVQQYAHKAYKDQVALLDRLNTSRSHVLVPIEKLARLVSWGRIPGNVNRELNVLLGDLDLPLHELYPLNCKFHKPRSRVLYVRPNTEFPFLLTHIVFSYLHNHGRATFLKKCLELMILVLPTSVRSSRTSGARLFLAGTHASGSTQCA